MKKGTGDEQGRRAFTAEFKLEAMRLMQEQRALGVSLAAIGRQLEVRPDQLRSWARRAGATTRLLEDMRHPLRGLLIGPLVAPAACWIGTLVNGLVS